MVTYSLKYAHALSGMASTLSVRFRPLFGCVRVTVIRPLPGAGNAGVCGVPQIRDGWKTS